MAMPMAGMNVNRPTADSTRITASAPSTPSASAAPYSTNRLFSIIDDTAKPSCVTHGAIPRAQTRSAMRGSSDSDGRRKGMGEPFLRKNCITNRADSAHEHTVASPAPRMPPSSTMMNR